MHTVHKKCHIDHSYCAGSMKKVLVVTLMGSRKHVQQKPLCKTIFDAYSNLTLAASESTLLHYARERT